MPVPWYVSELSGRLCRDAMKKALRLVDRVFLVFFSAHHEIPMKGVI
jgi:hypothetical protein